MRSAELESEEVNTDVFSLQCQDQYVLLLPLSFLVKLKGMQSWLGYPPPLEGFTTSKWWKRVCLMRSFPALRRFSRILSSDTAKAETRPQTFITRQHNSEKQQQPLDKGYFITSALLCCHEIAL